MRSLSMGRGQYLWLKVVGLLLCLTLPLVATAGSSPPADLQIKLRTAPLFPGASPGPYSVALNAKGLAELSTVDTGKGMLPATSVNLSTEAMEDIWSWIEKERFFELQPSYVDDLVSDGDYAQMTITANGRTHTVRTTNIRVYAFDRIVIVIGHYLPDERRIQYNALNVADYKAIER